MVCVDSCTVACICLFLFFFLFSFIIIIIIYLLVCVYDLIINNIVKMISLNELFVFCSYRRLSRKYLERSRCGRIKFARRISYSEMFCQLLFSTIS